VFSERQAIIVVLLTSSLFSSCAATQAQGVRGSVDEFLVEYVTAFNAKDVDRLRSLLHPRSLACITSDNKRIYDEALAVLIRDPIPSRHEFRTTLVGAQNELPFKGYAEFPIRPSHEIRITYSRGLEDSAEHELWLLLERDRWYEVDPCMTEATLKGLQADEPARQARIAKTRALVVAINEPLRSELKALIREGKSSSARQRYQDASGQDADASALVVYQLTPEAIQDK
jgi:hypothetical protein